MISLRHEKKSLTLVCCITVLCSNSNEMTDRQTDRQTEGNSDVFKTPYIQNFYIFWCLNKCVQNVLELVQQIASDSSCFILWGNYAHECKSTKCLFLLLTGFFFLTFQLAEQRSCWSTVALNGKFDQPFQTYSLQHQN